MYQKKDFGKRSGTPAEIAAIYGLHPGTLANMRSKLTGPRFFKRGRTVIYFCEDVELWLRETPVMTAEATRD